MSVFSYFRLCAFAPLREIGSLRMLCLFAFTCPTGCGMSDYQDRMDQQRNRVARFDELNNRLSDPIEMPKFVILKDPEAGEKSEKKEFPAWDFEVFLRLPKGFASTAKDRIQVEGEKLRMWGLYIADSAPDSFPCFRFLREGDNLHQILIAAWPLEKPAPKETLKHTAENFRENVEAAIFRHYEQTYKTSWKPAPKGPSKLESFETVTPYPDPAKPLQVTFQKQRYTDESNPRKADRWAYDVYISEQGGKQVAIVVHWPLQAKDNGEMEKSISACLGTLDVSPDAIAKRAAFRKYKSQ
jgi:hypothetical protein